MVFNSGVPIFFTDKLKFVAVPARNASEYCLPCSFFVVEYPFLSISVILTCRHTRVLSSTSMSDLSYISNRKEGHHW